MGGNNEKEDAAMAIYSVSSEISPLPLVPPANPAPPRPPLPQRNAKHPSQKDTVVISSEALQLAREGNPEE